MDAALVVPDSVKNRWGGWRPNSGRPKRDDWQEAFLARYAECGARYRAAADVGVDAKTVSAELERNHEFAEAYHEARQIFSDDLEILLRDQGDGTVRGNPLPVFALLKKHRPQEYIERHAVLNVDVHIDVPADQARQVLGEMLAHVTPATVERLSAEQPHRDAAPSLASQGSLTPPSGLILDVPAQMVRRDAESSESLTSESLGNRSSNRIQPLALAHKEASSAAAELAPHAVTPPGDAAPNPPSEPLNRAHSA